MAWNEPGGGKDRDPWGNRGRQGGPPDLDEVIRKLQAKLKGLFGGGATGGGGGPAGGAPGRGTWAGIALILVIVIGLEHDVCRSRRRNKASCFALALMSRAWIRA